jgi:hypothetical protein
MISFRRHAGLDSLHEAIFILNRKMNTRST